MLPMNKYGLSLMFWGVYSASFADIAGDLNVFFDELGYTYTSQDPEVRASDDEHFWGGGELHVKVPERPQKLVHFEMPDYKSSCSGIDLFTGSLSYISGDKLIDLGKQVMSNAGAYAVDVTLATTVPELKQVRDYLQTTVQKMNQTSINSCEMAEQLVGGVWPKTAVSQQKVCNDQRRLGREGLGHDYVAAHMACASDAFQSTMKQAAEDKKRKQHVVLGTNLMWRLLQNIPFLAQNQELAELVMSLTGSLIIDAQSRVTQVPSLLEVRGALVQALLGTSGSNDVKLWRCDEANACLHVHEDLIKLSKDQTLRGHVQHRIHQLEMKLKQDIALDRADKAFLSSTSLPVLKLLSALNSAPSDARLQAKENYITLIAGDLLEHYLSALIAALKEGAEASLLNEDLLLVLKQRIGDARQYIMQITPHMEHQLEDVLQLNQQITSLDLKQ